MFDLYPCRLGSLTSLGHDSYALRPCPQCAGAFAVCAVCEATGSPSSAGPALCPGCRHRAVLAAIAAGEVVFPDVSQASREGNAPTAVAVDQAVMVGELAHEGEAVTVDAPSLVLYNPAVVGQSHTLDASPALGALPVDTTASPLILLLLPVNLEGLPSAVQALSAVWTGTGALGGRTNGHMPQGPAEGERLPQIPRKTYLSDKPCPHGHVWRDSGKALRYHGSHMCTQCAAQTKPRRTAARTAAQEG